AGSDEVKIAETRVSSAQELNFTVAEELKPGSYTLFLRNPPGQTAKWAGLLTVVLPDRPVVAPSPQPLPKPLGVPELLAPTPELITAPQILPSEPATIHFTLGGGYGVLVP